MTRLTLLRGISGSGKSTWAESQAGNPVIVSRDRIRMATFGTEKFIDEDVISDIEHAAIASGLKRGRHVIVDNTNINWRYVKAQAKIGWKAGASVSVKTFDLKLSEALKRNAERGRRGGRFVPEDVIRKQHDRLQGSKSYVLEMPVPPKPYEGTPGKPAAFLVDLDGTLFHMNGKRGPYDLNVDVDDVDDVVACIVATLGTSEYGGKREYVVIAMSGRKEAARRKSENALLDNGIPFDHLFMRADDDNRSDDLVKAELFDKHVRDNFDVKFVLDDRNQVVDMWRTMGLKCLQVAEGNF